MSPGSFSARVSARLRNAVAVRDADRFREDILAIRRWCIDISRDATAHGRGDLQRVMPAILDELDRALAGEPLAYALDQGKLP